MIAGLWSCEDDDNFLIADPQEAEFALLTPDTGSSIVITETTPQTNIGATFTWEDVDYGTPTEVAYTLEAAANGTDFATITTIISSPARNYSMTYAALQTLANSLDPTPDSETAEPVAIDFRVKSTVGTTGSEPKYSNVITLAVTPFIPTVPPVLLKRELYLVGPASEAGWSNNAGNPAMFRDSENDDLYVLVAYLNAGELKFLEKRGQWAPQYGGAGGILVARPTESDPDPSPIMVPSAGYYTITVNIADLMYSIVPFDASAAVSFTSVGIIGTATPDDWTTDTDLVASTLNPHLWHAVVELTPEAVKFRANDSWDVPGNWGGGTSTLAGQTSVNGGDFTPIAVAGSYEVWFNDIDGRYVFIPQD